MHGSEFTITLPHHTTQYILYMYKMKTLGQFVVFFVMLSHKFFNQSI